MNDDRTLPWDAVPGDPFARDLTAYGLSQEEADALDRWQARGTPRLPDALREHAWQRLRTRLGSSEELGGGALHGATQPPSGVATAYPQGGRRLLPQRSLVAPIRATVSYLSFAAVLLTVLLGIVVVARTGRPELFSSHTLPGSGLPACGADGEPRPAGSPLPVVPLAAATPGTAGNVPAVEFAWQATGAAESFTNVAGMAIDPRCRLWVTDQYAGRFQIYSLDGAFLETWGEPGAAPGQFDFAGGDGAGNGGVGLGAGGIAFAPDGGFYVLDAGNHRVQQFDPRRKFVRMWGSEGRGDGQFEQAVGIARDSKGRVYVLDQARADAQVFDATGRFLLTIGSPDVGADYLTQPAAFALAPDGNIWIADMGSGLHEFAADGTVVRVVSYDLHASLNGLAIDATGNIYCAGENRVTVYDPAGNRRFAWGALGFGAGQFLETSSLVLDGSGGVYVGEIDNQRIQKFSVRSNP